MEWIIHFGMAKTGTSAIQQGLHAHRGLLLEHGIFYPSLRSRKAHHLLNATFRPVDRVAPSLLHRAGSEAQLRVNAETGWEEVLRGIERHRPARTILSSENFFLGPVEDMVRFRERLEAVSPAIRICMYVRSPAPHYLSGANEEAKSHNRISPPHPLEVRETIETIEAAFGRKMAIRAFDPARLHEGDALADFLQGMIEAPPALRRLRGERVNETVSAEAMDILARHRQTNEPHLHRVQSDTQTLLLQTLRAIDGASGRPVKPRLHPEVAAAVVRASSDLLWLRDRYGVVFADVDYGSIDGTLPDEVAGRRRIDEICVVDAAWRDELLFRAMHQMLEAGSAIGTLRRILPIEATVRAYRGGENLARRAWRRLPAPPFRRAAAD